MYTTYHFKSTSEITTDVLDAIKTAFKGKSVVLTVEEETAGDVPDWHKKMVYDRLEEIAQSPEAVIPEATFQQKIQQLRK